MTRIRYWGAGVALGVAASLCLLGSADASTQSLTCGQTVTSNVTLTANLNCNGFGGPQPILTVSAPSLTINLNGHSILGPGVRIGISVEADSTTVTNGKLVDVGTGIVLDGVSGSTVSKISFNLSGSRDDYAVEADGGGSNTITQLSGTNLKRLVWLGFETNDTVSSNVSHGAEDAFYDQGGSGDTFSGNKAYADIDASFTCDGCATDTFTGNYSESNLDNEGFYDINPTGPETYTGNTVAVSGGDGFLFNYPGAPPTSGQPYTIQNNVVQEARFDGIDLYRGYFDNGGDPSTFPGSTMSGNAVTGVTDAGITVFGPLNTTITGNTASSNGADGFDFLAEGVPTMTLTGNTANKNQYDGFWIEQDSDGPEATFNHNTAIGNGIYAFELIMNAAGTVPWTGAQLIGRNSGQSQDCSGVTCSGPTPPGAGVPAITGTTVEGQTLAGTRGAWGISTIGQSFTYLWLKCDSGGSNCTPTSSTGVKYKLVHSDIGSTFELQVTANDDNGQTIATSPPSALITGLPPTNRSLPVINVVSPQKTLSGTNGTWSATDTITYAKQWLRCDSGGNNCSPIGGATGNQYSIVGADVGNTIRLQVTATANAANTIATSVQTAVIVGISPVYTSLPTISNTTTEGRTITSTNGTWTGTQPITFTRQWMRCDSGGANCGNIGGATGASYTTTMDDVGFTILLSFTATNATASYGTFVGPTYAILVVAPSNTTRPTISGFLRDGATLTAHTGTWNGGSPATSTTYQWFRCDPAGDLGSCQPITSPASTGTYVLTPSDVGNTILVSVEESNSAGPGDAASVVTGVIAGNPPVNTVLPSISGDLTTVGNPLTGSKGTWTGLGPITYSYQWLVCDGGGNNCNAIGPPSSHLTTFPLPPPGLTVRFQVTATNIDNTSGVVAVSNVVFYNS